MGNLGVRRNMLSLCSVLVLLSAMASPGWTADNESFQQYRMQSLLEYKGKTQFCNKAETVFTAKRHLLNDGKVKYVVSANEVTGLGDSIPLSLRELSFVVDRKNQRLSATGTDLALMEKVANQCAVSLKRVSRDDVGKTWKQAFDLSSIGNSVPGDLKFTLTAIPVQTRTQGELIAVRAMSEPFGVEITGGSAVCKMNCAYVFCPDFQEIIFSASVFGAATNCNGYGEGLKHTVTTWKVDAAGQPAEYDELGKDKDFAKLVSKLGVTKNVEVVKAAPLPLWAKSEGVRTAQVANLCASVSCEGALNPVATIYLPVASTVGLQSFGESLTLGTMLAGVEGSETPGGVDAPGVTGAFGGAFDFIGWNWPTGVFGTGLGLGIAGAAGAFDDGGGRIVYRSPGVP